MNDSERTEQRNLLVLKLESLVARWKQAENVLDTIRQEYREVNKQLEDLEDYDGFKTKTLRWPI